MRARLAAVVFTFLCSAQTARAQQLQTEPFRLAPRASVLFRGMESHREPHSVEADPARRNPAVTGATIGGAVLGTATAVAMYQFCDGFEGKNCGNVLALAFYFALGATVGAVVGGFIGSAFGD